ncbi:MAG: hypothetical protein ACLGIK_07470, partial [Gemmatimonadota bacterium]
VRTMTALDVRRRGDWITFDLSANAFLHHMVRNIVGALVEIGPDAHSAAGLDHTVLGVGIARKGWLAKGDVLNTRDAAGVLAFAAARRNPAPGAAAMAALR